MVKKSKLILGRNEIKHGRDFSLLERELIIEDYLSSNLTKQAIWKKYTGKQEEHGSLLKWMRKLGYDDRSPKEKINFVSKQIKMKEAKSMSSDSVSISQLKEKIKALENQLKTAEVKAIAFSTMVDIAEQEFNIPIRKKLNTRPSKK